MPPRSDQRHRQTSTVVYDVMTVTCTKAGQIFPAGGASSYTFVGTLYFYRRISADDNARALDPFPLWRRGLLRATLCQSCNVSPPAMFRLRSTYVCHLLLNSLFRTLTEGATAWSAAKNLQELFHETLTDIYFHVARLEKVFEEIDETPRGKTCGDHGDHRGRSGRDEGVQRRALLGRWSSRGSPGPSTQHPRGRGESLPRRNV